MTSGQRNGQHAEHFRLSQVFRPRCGCRISPGFLPSSLDHSDSLDFVRLCGGICANRARGDLWNLLSRMLSSYLLFGPFSRLSPTMLHPPSAGLDFNSISILVELARRVGWGQFVAWPSGRLATDKELGASKSGVVQGQGRERK